MGTITSLRKDAPTERFQFNHATVYVFGNAPWWDRPEYRTNVARSLLGSHDAATYITVIPPSPRNDHSGRFAVVQPRTSGEYNAEGAVLREPGSVGDISARDCHFLFLEHLDTGAVGFAHVGRDSLIQNPECEGCDAGIVSNLLNSIAPPTADRSRVRGFFGGGISAECFPHDDYRYLKDIVERYPTALRSHLKGFLDIPYVIARQLERRGVTEVTFWDVCSFKTRELGSYRAERAGIPGKEHANVLVVVRE